MELLIDGARYKLWTPQNEAVLEDIIKEHAKDIFGEDSIYFDIKQKIKSSAGIGSIPDGYVITLGDTPRWYIVEVELSSHPLFEHIVPQMNRFIHGIKNLLSQRKIVDALHEEISTDEDLTRRIQSKIGSTEIFKFLSDLVSHAPKLAIVIEQDTEELREAVDGLKLETKVVEFKTFEKEGASLAVHAHLFEPMDAGQPPEFLEELRKRFAEKKPEIKPNRVAKGYCRIPIAHEGIHTEWRLPSHKWLGIELHLERKRDENSSLLKKLKERQRELEKAVGEPLTFEFPWHGTWARIYTWKELDELTEELKQWAVDTMIRLHEASKPLLDKIDEKY